MPKTKSKWVHYLGLGFVLLPGIIVGAVVGKACDLVSGLMLGVGMTGICLWAIWKEKHLNEL